MDPTTMSAAETAEFSTRKRQRVYSSPTDDARTIALLEEDDALPLKKLSAVVTAPSLGSAVRDSKYYFHDGSFVLRVEDTLFKVHQSIMARDGSIFSTMFSLPQGGAPAEGDTDARALLLPDECAAEFRALLWAMYALPPELMAVHLPGADLARLACIAHKAARYGFKSVEQWALDALAEHAARKPCPLLAPLGADGAPDADAIRACAAQLTRLVGLAQECAHARLLDTLVKLLTGLVARSLPLAHLAACLADEFDLRTLRGHAYLEIMHKGTFVAARPQPGSTPPGDLDANGWLVLTVPQHYRLLAGYHALTGAWEALRTKPPAFEHAPNCGATWHQHGCTQSWLEFWKEKTRADNVLALGVADVLGRLRIIQKEFDRWGSATYVHHDCRNFARKVLADQLQTIETALPDYFSIPGPSS